MNLQPPTQDKNSPTNLLFSFGASKNDHQMEVNDVKDEEDNESL